MAMKIIKPNEPIPVKNVVITIYGDPSSGKTTFAYTADDVLLLDFDEGGKRTLTGRTGDIAVCANWLDADFTAEQLKPVKTIVIDTVGKMIQKIIAHIGLYEPNKAKNGMQLYGEVIKKYDQFVTKIKSLGLDLVFISHYVEEKKGDNILTRLDVGGKAKNDVYQSSDLLGYLSYDGTDRILNFNPVDGRIGKNTGNFAPINLKDGITLADIIATLKSKMTELSAEQVKANQDYSDAIVNIDATNTVEGFNQLMLLPTIANDKQGALKKRLVSAAKALLIDFDAKTKQFMVIENAS